jgi:hypothetical protein
MSRNDTVARIAELEAQNKTLQDWLVEVLDLIDDELPGMSCPSRIRESLKEIVNEQE